MIFIYPLNPDVSLEPTYIEYLLSALIEHKSGWGTGKLVLAEQPHEIYSVGHALYRGGYTVNIGHQLADNDDFNQSREVFGAPGTAPLIGSALIDDIAPMGNLFDPAMFMYFEDVDLDWRARRQGWQCWYEASAVAYHRGEQADTNLRTEALKNRFLSVVKNAYWLDLLCYNLPLILLHCLARLLISPPQL